VSCSLLSCRLVFLNPWLYCSLSTLLIMASTRWYLENLSSVFHSDLLKTPHFLFLGLKERLLTKEVITPSASQTIH
jgi:hypothetical protein